MSRSKLPKSVRKFLRAEKARLRREFFGVTQQDEEIKKLYQKITEAGYSRINIEAKKVGPKTQTKNYAKKS